MAAPLLVTKINLPQLRPDLISRPLLIDKLNTGLNGRLTLVSAPAGFGKTTLVAAWLQHFPISPHLWKIKHCAWLSLDGNDNEAIRFLGYLIAAIQVVHPGMGAEPLEILENSPKPNFQIITQNLLNEIAAYDQPLFITLDDYHEIHDEIIHQIVQTVVDYLPSNVHLVITTRGEPPLSLPRWRARGWLAEISASDLRFDQAEIGKFLQHTMHVEIPSEAVALLEERTEGWVAGIQLAVLSMADADFSPEFIREFSGRDRFVAEYLLSEVLTHQPTEVQRFLLPTAILDRFNASLCTALLHPEIPSDEIRLTQQYQDLVESLERSNLFIVLLDRENYWYRYHHLFAQLLRQRLARTKSTEEINKLYRRAAQWFAERGLLEEAIHYSLKGKDYELASGLISDLQAELLWNQGWGLQVRKWGVALPVDTLERHPKAAINIALAHMIRNEVKEALNYIELVRDDPCVKAEIFFIDSIFARNKGDLSQAFNLATKAFQAFESQDETLYIAAKTQAVVCLMTMGNLTGAEEMATSLRQEIQVKSQEGSNVNIQLIQILGFIKEHRGQLVEAEQIYLGGIKFIQGLGITLPLIGLLLVRLGAIYYQWNDLEKATDYCERGLVWGERAGIADILTHGLFVQVDLAIQRQDKVATRKIMERIPKILDWPEFSDFDSIIRAIQALFNLRLGNLPNAIRWADSCGLSLDDQPALKQQDEYQILARIRLEESRQLGLKNQASKVIILVDRLIHLATRHDFTAAAISCWAIKALLFDFMGGTKKAVDALHQALDLAFQGGYIRIFVDLGAPLQELIQKSLVYDPHMVYKRRLLLAFADEEIVKPMVVSPVQGAFNQLTPRESEILQLIAAGLSNKAIEDNLMISKNTVRTHIKNLYSKLGVNSRTQAIQKARSAGLI